MVDGDLFYSLITAHNVILCEVNGGFLFFPCLFAYIRYYKDMEDYKWIKKKSLR